MVTLAQWPTAAEEAGHATLTTGVDSARSGLQAAVDVRISYQVVWAGTLDAVGIDGAAGITSTGSGGSTGIDALVIDARLA